MRVEFANVEKMGSSQGENYLDLRGMVVSAVKQRGINRDVKTAIPGY